MKVKTNADSIRAMDDSDLRSFLCEIATSCNHCRWDEEVECSLKTWLKQPAEIEEDDVLDIEQIEVD